MQYLGAGYKQQFSAKQQQEVQKYLALGDKARQALELDPGLSAKEREELAKFKKTFNI